MHLRSLALSLWSLSSDDDPVTVYKDTICVTYKLRAETGNLICTWQHLERLDFQIPFKMSFSGNAIFLIVERDLEGCSQQH